MNLDDLVPSGGGSLRAPATPPVREPVATFTQTRVQHPDEIWSPRGSEIAPPGRPLTQPGHALANQAAGHADDAAERTHTAQDTADFHAAAGSIRSALRPSG